MTTETDDTGRTMPSHYDDLVGALVLDKLALDKNIVEHAELFRRVGEECVAAVDARDAAKARLAEVDAVVGLDLRASMAENGQKVTEGNLASMILTSVEHVEAADAWLQAKYAADMWGTLRESYLQRSYMIRSLVDLYTAGYFSEIDTRSAADVVAERGRQARKEQREARKEERAASSTTRRRI